MPDPRLASRHSSLRSDSHYLYPCGGGQTSASAGCSLWVKAGRLIEAVDPAPEANGPRVPLDTLLDDAGDGGVAAEPDRATVAGPGAPRSSR